MNLLNIHKRFARNRFGRESGASDIVVTLFMMPIVLGLVFALIDISSYFQVRAQVQNITRDGARQVALYGGTSPTIPLNVQKTGGTDVTSQVFAKLYKNGNCTLSACGSGTESGTAAKSPSVTCTPSIARTLNANATCSVTYYYRSIGGGIAQNLGFGAIVSVPIKISETFKVETRY
jgi:Flp pilus assembly protein TadG